MTKSLLFSLLFLLTFVFKVQSQNVTVSPEMREVEGLRRKGMTALVEYDKKTTERAWNRYLKDLGKVDTWKSGALVILGPNQLLPDFKGLDLISRLDATPQGTKVFLSLGTKGDYVEPGTELYEKAKAHLQNFCRQLYRDDISAQIEAAEKVVELVSRTHDKTVQMGEQLKRQLERNQADQQKLQKELEDKKTESERLKAEITQNKTDQEAALEEIKKVRKIAEEKKLRLQQL